MKENTRYAAAARENLLWSLQDFANYEKSVREWRGENSSVRRSYDEDIALFFQTYQAEQFARDDCAGLGFTPGQCDALKAFVTLLAVYDHSVRTAGTVDSEDIIADPRWRQISEAAGETLLKLQGDTSS